MDNARKLLSAGENVSGDCNSADAQVRFLLSRAYFKRRDLGNTGDEGADALVRQAVEIAENTGDPALRARIAYVQGMLANERKQFGVAGEHLASVMRLVGDNQTEWPLRMAAAVGLAQNETVQYPHQSERACEVWLKVLGFAQQAGYRQSEAEAENWLGYIKYAATRGLSDATKKHEVLLVVKEHASRAKELFEQEGIYKYGVGHSLELLGKADAGLGRTQDAMVELTEAVRQAEEGPGTPDSLGIINALEVLASLHEEAGDCDGAASAYEKISVHAVKEKNEELAREAELRSVRLRAHVFLDEKTVAGSR
jgi:tetratricopeptide (TPR) repeat protein